MTPHGALAETIHSLCPHGQLYSFSECPQRHHDEREAEETMAGLSARGYAVASLNHAKDSADTPVREAISE